jgi:multisubunit Na+/H+ antiporter MnhG subunit
MSSLYETSDERRLSLLDKSLDVILDETYERMLHYAQNLKGPITILHMLGVILPILGLVILPLVVSFMSTVKWYHIATLYNIILPVLVYLVGKNVLSKRPTGYGDTDIAELNPALKNTATYLSSSAEQSFRSIRFSSACLLAGFSFSSGLFLHCCTSCSQT